jgi:hypothetical protein
MLKSPNMTMWQKVKEFFLIFEMQIKKFSKMRFEGLEVQCWIILTINIKDGQMVPLLN